jgi:hypothetical protein
MRFLRKFFQSRESELDSARQEGVKEAHRQLLSELGYIIGTRRLLRHHRNTVPQNWVAAFELLLPGTDGRVLPEHSIKQELIKIGFNEQDAQALLNQRNRPEALVVQMVAVMSGMPEEKTWGLVRG